MRSQCPALSSTSLIRGHHGTLIAPLFGTSFTKRNPFGIKENNKMKKYVYHTFVTLLLVALGQVL